MTTTSLLRSTARFERLGRLREAVILVELRVHAQTLRSLLGRDWPRKVTS